MQLVICKIVYIYNSCNSIITLQEQLLCNSNVTNCNYNDDVKMLNFINPSKFET